MREKWNGFIMVIAGITCFLWIIGFGWVLKDYFIGTESALEASTQISAVPENQPQTVIPADGFNILALGDSLTRGIGDPNGKGYVGFLRDSLSAKTEEELSVFNFGISGFTSERLYSQISQAEVQKQIGSADAILITIGGNDLFRGGQALIDMDLRQIEESMKSFSQNANQLFEAGVDVLEMSRKLPALEDLFLEMTGGESID
jgi:lysophospholipase L1-like esterase